MSWSLRTVVDYGDSPSSRMRESLGVGSGGLGPVPVLPRTVGRVVVPFLLSPTCNALICVI